MNFLFLSLIFSIIFLIPTIYWIWYFRKTTHILMVNLNGEQCLYGTFTTYGAEAFVEGVLSKGGQARVLTSKEFNELKKVLEIKQI